MRCGPARLAAQRLRRGAAALFGHITAVDMRGARALLGALAFAGERHAGAARLGQADGDGLLGATRAVLALANFVEFLAHDLARHGAGGLSLPRLAAHALESAFFGHRVSFQKASSAPPWHPRARAGATALNCDRRG